MPGTPKNGGAPLTGGARSSRLCCVALAASMVLGACSTADQDAPADGGGSVDVSDGAPRDGDASPRHADAHRPPVVRLDGGAVAPDDGGGATQDAWLRGPDGGWDAGLPVIDDAGAAPPRDGAPPVDAAPDPDAADPPPADASVPTDAAAPAPDAGGPEPPRLQPDAAWRLAPPAGGGRWWLVAPDGSPTFFLGVNTVMRATACDGLAEGWIRRMAPTRAALREWARLGSGEAGGEQADRPYCFNSVGAFSEINDFDDTGGDSYLIRAVDEGGAGAPYGVVLHGLGPASDDRALRDHTGAVLRGGYARARVGDPFNPAWVEDVRAEVERRVRPRRDDPRLQMWFAGNEIGLFDRADREAPGVRDLRRWIWTDCPPGSTLQAPRCAPHALAAFLAERYGTIEALDAAWESAYGAGGFLAIVEGDARPVPYVQHCNLTCREDLQRFVHRRLLPAWIAVVTGEIRRVDPVHLIATPRLALASPAAWRFWTAHEDVWADAPEVDLPNDRDVVHYAPWRLLGRRGDTGFDLVAVNVYVGDDAFPEPWLSDGFARVHAESGLPILVSELGVRARIDGWSNRGGAFAFVSSADDVDDQVQRGAAYQGQIEQLSRLPMVIGAAWHAWSDRFTAADPEQQMNLGLMQCEDPARGHVAGRRWPDLDAAIHATNCGLTDRLLAAEGAPDGAALPFGSHPPAMVADALRVGRPQAELDRATAAFYDDWKARYLAPGCAPGEWRVRSTPATQAFTVSEGQGYGMLATVWMAGHDPEARALFDGLYRYARAHPSQLTPRLMAWAQDEACRDVQGADAATDGDLDIAYALLLAARQWGRGGDIDYAAEAAAIIAALEGSVLHPSGTVLLGDWVAPGQRWYTGTRSSDLMPGHFAAFAARGDGARWQAALDRSYRVVEHLQDTHAAATGLLPDFVVDATGDAPAPAPADWLEGANDGRYAWNACRAPWRLGVHALFSGDARARRTVGRMTRWARAATGDDPAGLRAGYRLDGRPLTDATSPAYLAPFAVAAMVPGESSQAWLDALWDRLVARAPQEYFGDSIKLLALIVLSNNGWVP